MTADAIVGEHLMVALHRRKMTRRSLAPLLGLTEQGLGRKINGQTRFTLDELLFVARFLDLPVTDLLPGNDYDPAPSGRGRVGDLCAIRDSNPEPAD